MATILSSVTVKPMTAIGRPFMVTTAPAAPLTSAGVATRNALANMSARFATACRAVRDERPRSCTAVGSQHDVRVEHRNECIEVATARRGEEGIDDLPLARAVTVGRRRGAFHPPTRPARELAGRRRRAPDDGCDLLERHPEHVVQHEGEPLGGGKHLQHHEQGEPDGVGEQRFLFRVDALFGADDRIREVDVQRVLPPRRARSKHVQTHPRRDRRQPTGEVLDLTGVAPAESQPRLLHGIVRLAEGAEHPVGDGAQVASMLLELPGQPVNFVHRSHSFETSCQCIDRREGADVTRPWRTDMYAPKKIAVAGATGRVGRHVVDVLTERGHVVVPMSRASGVDVITGGGLAAALAGVECVIDAATGPSPEQEAATTFFTTAARNLHEAGGRAGVRRMIAVSIIGTDRFTAGYGAAKIAHERAMLAGPIPAHVLRAAQFHEFVEQLVEWGTQGEVSYVSDMRIQPVAARTVAEVLADIATDPGRGAPLSEVAGPQEESLVSMATLLMSRRGHPLKIEGVTDPTDPDHDVYRSGALLPGPGAVLAGPSFEEWLDSTS